MRARAMLFAVVVLCGAAFGAYRLAQAAVGWYEGAVDAKAGDALAAAGQDWASVAIDGMRVTLKGAAPDESSRFGALEIIRQVVDPSRIEDATTVAAAPPLPPPPIALELLRNEADVSLIGLVPETGGRDVIRSALGAGGLSEHVTDMLEASSEPAPAGWTEALGFGLSVLAELPRTKISVAPGKVSVAAVADDDAEREALEARLRRAVPAAVSLELDISAPRPVIAPFTFDLALRDGVATLGACSADSPEAAARILAAARGVGLDPAADCRIGVGSPSPDWAAAAASGIGALRQLGGGEFTLNDLAGQLSAPAGTPADKVAAVAASLAAALPDRFTLTTIAVTAAPAAPPAPAPTAAPVFEAALQRGGGVRLTGPVRNSTSQQAIVSYAASLFGHDRVTDATVTDPTLPEGWPGRVLAGIEALAKLEQGDLQVTPDRVVLTGWGIEPDLDARLRAELAAKLRAAPEVNVGFNAGAAAAQDAAQPRPEICADQIAGILDAGSIQFAAGSAEIAPESRGVIAAVADVLRGCPGADFEIGGHTDSQGTPDDNRRLSEARAQAVLDALRQENLPDVRLTARGFGADDPVADNADETGRAKNRRIEFTLIAPESPPADVAPTDTASLDPKPLPGDGGAAAPDAPEPAAAQPAAAEPGGAQACVASIQAILGSKRIDFAPGSATLAPASAQVIAQVAQVLRGCPDAAIEVGGHTDSQGSESGNLGLSQQRADAVLAALRGPDLPLAAMTARGYGEADPIADNGTDAGRQQNRRIAFTALAVQEAGPVAEGATAPADDASAACAARIDAAQATGKIEFAVGTATIADTSKPVIEAIAGALRQCPDVALEISGYTDSIGSEEGNLRLSQQRADAVLAALRAPDLPLPAVTAHGYGESNPVADNSTFEGRNRNRRITFSLTPAEETGEGDGSE